MNDVFRDLLGRADASDMRAAILHADEVATWPERLLDILSTEGVIQAIEPAGTIRCVACDEGHWEEPEWIDERAFLHCSEFGKVQLDPSLLQRWQVSPDGVAFFAARSLRARAPTALVEGRVWKLSRLHAGGHPWLPLVVRGWSWPDSAVIDSALGQYTSALVIAFASSPTPAPAPFVDLSDLVTVTDKGIELNWDVMEEYCSFAAREPATQPTASRSGSERVPGGRPAGRSIGWLLACWIDCCRLADKLGSIHAAYDAIEKHLLSHPEPAVVVPLRSVFKTARSAALARKGNGPCLWYRHEEGLPSELRSR